VRFCVLKRSSLMQMCSMIVKLLLLLLRLVLVAADLGHLLHPCRIIILLPKKLVHVLRAERRTIATSLRQSLRVEAQIRVALHQIAGVFISKLVCNRWIGEELGLRLVVHLLVHRGYDHGLLLGVYLSFGFFILALAVLNPRF